MPRHRHGRNTKRPSIGQALGVCEPKTRSRYYFLLRRWWRVLRSSLRCFFFAMRLRRFLMTEPTENLTMSGVWTRIFRARERASCKMPSE